MAKYPETLDGMPPPLKKRGFWRFIWRRLPSVLLVLMLTLFTVVLLWPYVVITVPSGKVGVLWKRFNGFDFYCWCFTGRGTMLNPRQLRDEGLHIIWPWDRLFLYNLRLQSASQIYNAISKDGVIVTAQINIRFQLLHNSVAVLHKFIGPTYLESIVGPEIGSQARQVISQYTAQEVYTSREAIQEKIRENARKGLGANLNKLVQPEAMEQPDPKHYNEFLQYSIQILDTLVLSIELPPAIVAAINRQTEQFYMIQEFRFRVLREAEESKRKQIEANGISAFQRTVSQGISDSYLRWRGIEATLALAQSQNSKIVVIGSGKDGLPIILGNVDTPAPPSSGPTIIAPPPANPPPGAAERQVPNTSATEPEGMPAQPDLQRKPPSQNPAPDKTGADKPAAASPDKPSASASPLLSDIESLLSRISRALRSESPAPNAGTATRPN